MARDDTQDSQQALINRSFDTTNQLNMVEPVSFDGYTFRKTPSTLVAQKITKPDANTTYIAIAPIGTDQATAGWQVKKVLVAGNDTTITWCDGNANFDNVATDLTTLTYG
jgi:hypothetical protein